MINKGGAKQKQVPLETDEQRRARAQLQDFAETGRFGDFQAGAEVPLGYGDYGATDIEKQGLSSLQGLLQSPGVRGEMMDAGDKALMGFLQTDPAAIQAQFNPFREQVQRQIGESERGLRRGAAFGGNLYSTDTVRGLGDIQARGNETLTAELARLTDQASARRLQAVPLAYQSAEARQGQELQRVAASQQYGALTRQLNDQQIKARDAELLRRRQELQLPIQAAQTVAGGGANFGVPEVQAKSPYADLLGMVGQIGGGYLQDELAMKQYKRYFPGATTQPATPEGPNRMGYDYKYKNAPPTAGPGGYR